MWSLQIRRREARENVVAGEDEKGKTGDCFACLMESCLGARKKDALM